MKTSSLDERLEEFEATVNALRDKPPYIAAVADRESRPRPLRRLSFDTRRIQIRDTGLPHFRIF